MLSEPAVTFAPTTKGSRLVFDFVGLLRASFADTARR
jgi:hypothetical protein